MATWPAGLPQTPLKRGFSQMEKTSTITSPMGYGPAKKRRQTTADIQLVTAGFILDDTQKNTLVAFYETDTAGGSIPFDWVDQLNGGAASYRFTKPIQWSVAGCSWYAALSLEILP